MDTENLPATPQPLAPKVEASRVTKIKRIASKWFPLSGKERRATLFYTFVVGLPLTFCIFGVEMISNYFVAKCAFTLAAVSTLILAWMALEILARKSQIFWSSLITIIVAAGLVVLYARSCPNITVFPGAMTFGAGDSYILNISNPSDSDKYAVSAIIQTSIGFSTPSGLQVVIDPNSLKSLQEQPFSNGADPIADMATIFGEEKGMPMAIVYVYHLGPKESRRVNLRLTEPDLSQTVKVSAGLMSYSNTQVPINRSEGGVLSIPFGVERPFIVQGAFFFSSTKQIGKAFGMGTPFNTPGCYYISIIGGGRQIPQHNPSLNQSHSCDLSKFDTR